MWKITEDHTNVKYKRVQCTLLQSREAHFAFKFCVSYSVMLNVNLRLMITNNLINFYVRYCANYNTYSGKDTSKKVKNVLVPMIKY